jgi:hypothetical protein
LENGSYGPLIFFKKKAIKLLDIDSGKFYIHAFSGIQNKRKNALTSKITGLKIIYVLCSLNTK